MRPRLKLALANALLLFVSIAVTYLVASFVIFRFLLPHLSLNLHPHFPDIAEVFAQTSKAGTVPRDYIALLGDSYAEGQGDGLLAANGDRAKFQHSAHVLHRLTGRDVVSLGIGGAGSVQAMVRQPARILNGNCFLYPRLDPPRQIVVYFYEGNDLDENGYIVGRVAGEGAVTRESDRAPCRRALRRAPAASLLHRSRRDDVQDGTLPHHQHRELRDAAQALGAQQGAGGRSGARGAGVAEAAGRTRSHAHSRHRSRCSTCRSNG